MLKLFGTISPVWQAFLAGNFTFFITLLGSSIVLFFRNINRNIMDGMMAISAGIMLSASFFSLLDPAIELGQELFNHFWITILCGFLVGGILLFVGDKIFDVFSLSKYHGSNLNLRRCILLFASITLHNIPEGLVLGVAYGAASLTNGSASLISAITLTIGIAIQNFPEGSAISLPLRREGISRRKSFFWGACSAIVEPISAVIGVLLILKIQVLLPFIMSFTAGAMIFVVLMELVPETQKNEKKDIMALLIMIGFSIMMVLELTLG